MSERPSRVLRANLRAALLLFTPGHPRFHASVDQVFGLLSLASLLLIFGQRALVEGPVAFNVWAVPNLALGCLATLAAAWLGSRITLRPHRILPLATAGAALWFPLAILWLALDALSLITDPEMAQRAVNWSVPIVLTVVAVLVYRLLRLVLGLKSIGALVLTPLYALVAFGPLYAVPPQYTWVEIEATPDAKVNAEDVFYAQPERLDDALAALLPQRPGVVDLYFLAVAADAWQDVFMKEATSVRALFDERFDTRGRSLALINHPSTVDRLPIASRTNIERALAALGRILDAQEDILFVYLTTHGSEDHTLEMEFDPLPLKTIGPEDLKRALAATGLGNRIVVISACYSGGFIAPLSGPETSVITAAASDRTSFGCETGEDFTYFGRALFHEALRKTTSLPEAFRAASASIAARERAERLPASLPRMATSATVEAQWKLLEGRLNATIATGPGSTSPPPAMPASSPGTGTSPGK